MSVPFKKKAARKRPVRPRPSEALVFGLKPGRFRAKKVRAKQLARHRTGKIEPFDAGEEEE